RPTTAPLSFPTRRSSDLDPRLAGDTEPAYASFLADPLHGQPNFLLTTSTAAGDFTPIVTQPTAVAAAHQERFRPVSRLALPDGRDRKSTRLNSSHLVISY